ncbi:MAG: hypothetical protein MUO50_14520 [Longimicrobiales bacterium]|nr:hypothetical protein [Longimicrobiales bacterium]
MTKFDEPDYYRQDELLQIKARPPQTSWMDTPVDLRKGTYIYPGKAKNLEVVGLPNPREWAVDDIDWSLPEGWQKTIPDGMAQLLWHLSDPARAHQPGGVDPPKIANVSLAPVAERA